MNNCTNKNVCGCTKETADCETAFLPAVMTTTMAYVPFQIDLSYYSTEEALSRGTLFCDLDKPFKGRCVC